MMPRSRPAIPVNRHQADLFALGVLAILVGAVLWNRFVFDVWLARLDIVTFLLPWYVHLGERLRDLDLPGWNPYLFSGTPFAGDPQSGWMYLPAMLSFIAAPGVAGFKAMVALQMVIGGGSMYAYARVLGMRPPAALLAAVVFLFGPFLHWNTYCCAIMGQFATWTPLMLLGIELALRAPRRRQRWLAWLAAGFGLSQIFAGWIGQGSLFALLLVAAYLAYRVCFPAQPAGDWRQRLTAAALMGIAVGGHAAAFGAGGLWPRFEVNAVSNLAGGDYSALGASRADSPPWTASQLVLQLLGGGHDRRESALGGSVVVLALLAPIAARRRFAAPFFAALTLVALILTQETTPLHRLFYLIPRFQVLHEHDPWRVLALAAFGPPLLAGAIVESLPALLGRKKLLLILPVPFLLLLAAALLLDDGWETIGWTPLVAAGLTTVLLGAALAASPDRVISRRVSLLHALLIAIAFAQPAGLELTGSWLGWPKLRDWGEHWRPPAWIRDGFRTEIARRDPGGAGEFLREQLATNSPFRYVGYGGVDYPAGESVFTSYLGRRFEPSVQAILVNGRPMFLGLYDIQGYNPIQLARYTDFIEALNGQPQDYHTAYVLPSGVDSPLLELLDARYVLLDRSLDPSREDVQCLTAGRRLAFSTDHVTVYETVPTPAHAWIVHDLRPASREEALSLLAAGAVDPSETALIEVGNRPLPETAAPEITESEWARITRYEPDALTVELMATAPGLLVLSEIYAPGWEATVDGESAPIFPVNGALRGIPVPAGEHVVALHYRPLSLRLGSLISAGTILIAIASFAFRRIPWVGPSNTKPR